MRPRAQLQTQSIGSCLLHPVKCVSHGVGKIAGDAATSVFDAICKEFATLAEHATAWVWTQLDAATAVRLVGGQWKGIEQVTIELGVLTCFVMLILQVIAAVLRHDIGALGRGMRGLAIAMIGMFASLIITDSLLSVVDGLSNGVMQALAGTTAWSAFGDKVIHPQTLTGGLLGPPAMLLASLILLCSSVFVWLALMVRKMLLVIGAAFAPIAFGGAPFEPTSKWVHRWIEFTLAMVFSKLVLMLIFGIGFQVELGAGQVGKGATQQITQFMTGLLIMAIAGFAPWMALQFVHWTGSSMDHVRLGSQAPGAAAAGAGAAVATPRRAFAGARRVFGGSTGANGGGGGTTNGAPGSGGATGAPAGARGGRGDHATATSGAGAGGAAGGSRGQGLGTGGRAADASESAYQSGRSQTAQALAFEGGEAIGANGGDGRQGNSGASQTQRGGDQQSGRGRRGDEREDGQSRDSGAGSDGGGPLPTRRGQGDGAEGQRGATTPPSGGRRPPAGAKKSAGDAGPSKPGGGASRDGGPTGPPPPPESGPGPAPDSKPPRGAPSPSKPTGPGGGGGGGLGGGEIAAG